MNANPPKKSPTSVTSEPQDLELEDQIRERAYELYEAGHEQEDWLRAEAEIMQKKAGTIAA